MVQAIAGSKLSPIINRQLGGAGLCTRVPLTYCPDETERGTCGYHRPPHLRGTQDMMTENHSPAGGWFRSRTGLVFLVFLAIAAFFLVTEHRAHALSVLPFLLVLLCPLLHLFLHRRHGSGRAGHGLRPSPRQRSEGGER